LLSTVWSWGSSIKDKVAGSIPSWSKAEDKASGISSFVKENLSAFGEGVYRQGAACCEKVKGWRAKLTSPAPPAPAGETCSICLECLEKPDKPRDYLMTSCGHYFHRGCI